MNPRKNSNQDWWDERMPEAKALIANENYRIVDLAEHFGRSKDAVAMALNKRGIRIMELRYKHRKEAADKKEGVTTLAKVMNENRELRSRIIELEDALDSVNEVFTSKTKIKGRWEQG